MRLFNSILIVFLLTLMLIGKASSEQKTESVCGSENQRAFDFWIGEWRVTTPNGKHAGDSKITSIQDGCVIQENWRSATSDYTGTSYNAYNQEGQQWEQIWLDNKGGRLHLKGQKQANQMILRSDAKLSKDGKETYNQITWTANADGTVRQFWEVYTQGEKTTVSFDGLYTPIKP